MPELACLMLTSFDDEEALLAACTYLQRDGLFAHQACSSYLAFTLEQGQLESNSRTQTALLLCARLFNERPDRSPQATQASARVRQALLSLLQDSKLCSEEELYALSALAGCGTPASLPLSGLAAMLGAMFILDDPIFNGLAISLIFGILVSTVLTLVVIPAVYYLWRRRDLEGSDEPYVPKEA